MRDKNIQKNSTNPQQFKHVQVENGVLLRTKHRPTVDGRNPAPPGMIKTLKIILNNGINYQTQLVSRISEPSTVSYPPPFEWKNIMPSHAIEVPYANIPVAMAARHLKLQQFWVKIWVGYFQGPLRMGPLYGKFPIVFPYLEGFLW